MTNDVFQINALILCRLVGFDVNSFDRQPQLGAVGPVVYVFNEFSPLSSFVIRCRFCDLIIHCRQPGSWVGPLAPPSWLRCPLGLVACLLVASFLILGVDLPFIVLIVLHSFVCSARLLFWRSHLLQGGRCRVSGSEIISCSHLFQYLCWKPALC